MNEIEKTNFSEQNLHHFLKIALQKINGIIPCETHTLIIESQKRRNESLLLYFGLGKGINDFIRHCDYDSIEKIYLFLKQNAPCIRNSFSPSDFCDFNEDVENRARKSLPPLINLVIYPVNLWNEKIGIFFSINKKDGSEFFDKDLELISETTEITGIADANIILQNEESGNPHNYNSNIDCDMVQNIHSDKITALKRIAGGIAHTMNSPLTGVVTNLGMINSAEEIFRNTINEILKICKNNTQDENTVNLIELKIKKLNELECKRNKWRKTAEKGGKICTNIIEELLLFSKESSFEKDLELISETTEITGIADANIILQNEESGNPHNYNSNIDCDMVQNIHSDKITALKRIAGGIAHTMNSPLTGVVTNLGMINSAEEIFRNTINEILKICKNNTQDENTVNLIELKIKKLNELECKRNKWRKTAEKGGKICKNTIEELLLFSKESSFKNYTYFNINRYIKKIIEALEKQFSACDVIIEKKISDSPIMINGNVGEICHAFFNIISNAFHSINKKPGKISVSTSIDGKKYASLIIQYNGCEIINDLEEKVFEPYFTSSKLTGKNGLGLSISQTLIEKHGGIIDFVSSPKEGTIFIIKLPARQIN